MAALKAVGESCAMPLRYYEVNVSGTVILMQVNLQLKLSFYIWS